MKNGEIWIPVAVQFKDGKPVSIHVDPYSAPYTFAGTDDCSERWDSDRQEWSAPSERQRDQAERFLDRTLERAGDAQVGRAVGG